jgi:hypothetical protein
MKYYLDGNSVTMRQAGHVACVGDITNASKIFVVTPERKRLLLRPGCKAKHNIRMDVKAISGR